MEGISFDNCHSYNDLALILNSVSINPPEPKTYFVDIAGADGGIDLSKSLTNDVVFKNRKLNFQFTYIGNHYEQISQNTKLLNNLHGRTMKIVMDADANYYYQGRVEITKCLHKMELCIFDIECDVDPYKYDWGDDWLWDPFDFENDFINETSDLNVNGELKIKYIGRRKKYIPWIECTESMTLIYNSKTYDLKKGKNKIFDVVLSEGENNLIFVGNGIVTLQNQGGAL